MEESKPRRVEPTPPRIRAVPIAVTPEGFWCCPSPAALHKSLKNPHHHGGSKQQHKIPSAPPSKAPSVQNASSVADEPGHREAPDEQNVAADRRQEQAGAGDGEAQQHKICVGFGQPETSDLTVMLQQDSIPVTNVQSSNSTPAPAPTTYYPFSETQTESQIIGYEEDLTGRQKTIDRVRSQSINITPSNEMA